MKLFYETARRIAAFQKITEDLREGNTPALCVGLSSIHKSHFAFAAAEELQEPILLVTADEASASRLMSDINAMAGSDYCQLFPAREFCYRRAETASGEYEQLRLGLLSRLLNHEVKIVVASVPALMSRTIPPEVLRENTFLLRSGEEIPLDTLIRKLIASGYSRRPQVDGPSQFSVRGGIVDFFPPKENNPIRLEYWGDEINELSYFELDSQRRTEPIDRVQISPANEVSFEEGALLEKLREFAKSLGGRKTTAAAKENILKDIDQLEQGLELASLDRYFPLAYARFATLLDYFEHAPVIISERSDVTESARAVFKQYSEDIKILFDDGQLCKGLDSFYLSAEEFMEELAVHRIAYFDTFARGGVPLKDLVSLSPLQNSNWNGDIKLLKSDLDSLLSQGYCCFVFAGTDKAAQTLANDLSRMGLPAQYEKDVKKLTLKRVFVLEGSFSSGFEYPDNKISMISTGRAAAATKRTFKKRKGEEIRSLFDLTEGDYVVHVTHGIGIFAGVQKLEMQGIVKDYIKIQYADADVLYVPVTQLDLVAKYIGPKDDSKVKLHKLRSGEWQKARSRVKKAVDEMADELIALYAKRMKTKGYAFSPDDDYQRDFEAHFAYEETDDQLRCAAEIKADMEKDAPMERLLCGDVGFGKTEVALRAAFKCVVDGKQCAILCPTTILAWQHYQTLLTRMSSFPVEVELLSRFRTPKEQKKIVEKLERGLIDIVVGTHRVVSQDVHFKDLGLAIIDEEQRFGVHHKDRFKEMHPGVDMLSLSATPIPRTLNMAMSGIRDMSVIEEAPQNRHPIQTYVMEYDKGVIAEALRREYRRGGQSYYIFNNIENISSCAARVKEMVPEANVAFAHGRMSEDEISAVWKAVMDHEIDILVCTTIIETGVDVSNVNTLVIEHSDRMGLSQLYQLRGRVGRSSRRAYAYFTFQQGKMLTEVATKRLSAIREFTKFGSGFRVALRDLEIRGAGNILGTRQHGHMEAVGYDMYLRLLSEAVAEKQGKTPENKASAECLVDIRLEAHIPDEYIDNPAQRIEIYRKIASVRNEADAMDMTDELFDRFGEPPQSVMGLIEVARLRNKAAHFGFKEITQKGDALHFIPEKLDVNLSMMLSAAMKGKVTINAGEKPYLAVKLMKRPPLDVICEVTDHLTHIEENNPMDQLS